MSMQIQPPARRSFVALIALAMSSSVTHTIGLMSGFWRDRVPLAPKQQPNRPALKEFPRVAAQTLTIRWRYLGNNTWTWRITNTDPDRTLLQLDLRAEGSVDGQGTKEQFILDDPVAPLRAIGNYTFKSQENARPKITATNIVWR